MHSNIRTPPFENSPKWFKSLRFLEPIRNSAVFEMCAESLFVWFLLQMNQGIYIFPLGAVDLLHHEIVKNWAGPAIAYSQSSPQKINNNIFPRMRIAMLAITLQTTVVLFTIECGVFAQSFRNQISCW